MRTSVGKKKLNSLKTTINGRNNPDISITRPYEHLKCCGFQRFTNGLYQGAHSFQCNQNAMATRSKTQGIATQNNFLEQSLMWFCEVTWQIRYFISPLALNQWPPNIVNWWLTVRALHPQSHTKLWMGNQVRSHDKSETYFNYHNAYGHQTCQGGNILW